MLRLVAQGAALSCSEGTNKSDLLVLHKKYIVDGKPIANIKDHQPMANIQPFGQCKAIANPQVAAATAAAMGTLTPMPCVPVTPAPWTPGAKYINQEIGGALVRALTNDSTCSCTWTGIVSIEDPNTDLNVE